MAMFGARLTGFDGKTVAGLTTAVIIEGLQQQEQPSAGTVLPPRILPANSWSACYTLLYITLLVLVVAASPEHMENNPGNKDFIAERNENLTCTEL